MPISRTDPFTFIDRCIKGAAVVTILLGVTYAFAFRTNLALKLAFLVAFFIGIDLAAIGALLVAFREVKQRGSIRSIVFFGSFGIVVLAVSAFIIISLIPR